MRSFLSVHLHILAYFEVEIRHALRAAIRLACRADKEHPLSTADNGTGMLYTGVEADRRRRIYIPPILVIVHTNHRQCLMQRHKKPSCQRSTLLFRRLFNFSRQLNIVVYIQTNAGTGHRRCQNTIFTGRLCWNWSLCDGRFPYPIFGPDNPSELSENIIFNETPICQSQLIAHVVSAATGTIGFVRNKLFSRSGITSSKYCLSLIKTSIHG